MDTSWWSPCPMTSFETFKAELKYWTNDFAYGRLRPIRSNVSFLLNTNIRIQSSCWGWDVYQSTGVMFVPNTPNTGKGNREKNFNHSFPLPCANHQKGSGRPVGFEQLNNTYMGMGQNGGAHESIHQIVYLNHQCGFWFWRDINFDSCPRIHLKTEGAFKNQWFNH